MLRVVAAALTMVLAVGAAGSAGVHASGSPRSPGSPVVVAPAAAPRAGQTIRYAPPLAGPMVVLRGFDPPATVYGPGHLGVDLRAPDANAAVLAAGAGRVSFAGSVAGRGVIVVVHPDGVSTEYEPVRPIVHAGQSVQRGQMLGPLSGRHPGCAVQCLHWGAKRNGTYLDPLSLLRPLGPVRLLPWSTGAVAAVGGSGGGR